MTTRARWGRAVLGALLLALCIMAPRAAHAGGVASAGSPARVSVAIPPAAADAGVVMLELGIKARPSSGHLGAVVRLTRPGGPPVELGRISVTAGGEQRYQFNVAGALKRVRGGAAEIEVELIDRGSGGALASGAELAVGHARIVAR
jgi:hypothetical protein